MIKYLWQKFFPKKTENYIFKIDNYCPDFLDDLVHTFGSRAWGGYTEKSDADLFTSRLNVPFILHRLDERDIAYRVITGGSYDSVERNIRFYWNGLKYNCALVPPSGMPIYLQAKTFMEEYRMINPECVATRDLRVQTFEQFMHINPLYLSTPMKDFLKQYYPEVLI